MFAEIRPKRGMFVVYWTPGDQPEDDAVPHLAIVCNVAKEGELEWRPYLNLTVFRANDAKHWARMDIPAVWDDGGTPVMAHRYSLPGEYPNDGME